MPIYRYLLNIAYIGKSFRGAQRQMKGGFPRPDDPTTVQGQIEMALQVLKPSNEPVVTIASRTDSGVHAFNSACHVDLLRGNGTMYEPQAITTCLNKYFTKNGVDIKVLQSILVPNTFHCRHNAKSRTYLYRLIVKNADKLNESPNLHYIPIEELHRCLFYCTNTFDINLMKNAANLFIGTRDFRTFMGKHDGDESLVTRKEIIRIDIEQSLHPRPGYSTYSWPNLITKKIEPEEYLLVNIYVKGKGFLYKQVRRTVGTLIAVAQGKISSKDIKFMLEVPSHRSWFPRIKTVPAYGLYLCEVEYSTDDLTSFEKVCLR